MKKIIVLGLLSFALFVLLKTPVTLLLPHINKNPYFQAHTITGNIFSANMATTGKIDTLSYQINPWQLLLANLSVDFEAKKGNNIVRGAGVIDLITQSITLNNVTGMVDLALFQQYAPVLSTVDPHGKLTILDIDATWDDLKNNPIPQQLFGKIELLKLNLLGQAFGGYQLDIKTQAPDIIGNIANKALAATDTKIKLSLSATKKQLSISGKVLGKNANVKAILGQLGIANIKQTIRY